MPNLYEINQELREIDKEAQQIFEETGSVPDDIVNRWNEVDLSRDQKIENSGCFIKNKKLMIKGIDEEIDLLQLRKKRHLNRIEWLNTWLTMNMLHREEFESSRLEISWRKSDSLKVRDEFKVLDEYVKVKSEPVIQKDEMKIDMKAAWKKLHPDEEMPEVLTMNEFPGVELITKQNIQIK